MILTIFTFVHVAISLAGIFSGLVVAYGLLTAHRLDGWTAVFLISTIATSVTGFFFPVHHFMPSHAVGIVSLCVLAFAIHARYRRHLADHWRAVYVAAAMSGFFFNFFVLITQLFQKVPALKALAPTQSEPPFAFTQLSLLILFGIVTAVGLVRFHPQQPMFESFIPA
jgi:hypothetical protein